MVSAFAREPLHRKIVVLFMSMSHSSIKMIRILLPGSFVTAAIAVLVIATCGQATDPTSPVHTPLLTNDVSETPATSATPQLSPTDRSPTPTNVPPSLIVPSPVPEPTAIQDGFAPRPRGLSHELPERDLHELAKRLGGAPKDSHRTLQVIRSDLKAGSREEFFVTDTVTDTTYTIGATLQVVSPNAYWYVDDELDIRDEDLQQAANEYESAIRPTLLEAFGDVWNPGVDGDPRLTVLHTDLGGGVAGYFDSRHEFPLHTQPNSNEREMLYMDGVAFRPGSLAYMSVLAHELQHAIHWAHDSSEESWVNEGLSEVAKVETGYEPTFIDAFLRRPSTQLTFWEELGGSIPHYGAATLFMLYLQDHYGDSGSLRSLITNSADGVDGINEFLSPHSTTFDGVYADWVAANYLDSDTGPYGYSKHDVQVRRIDSINRPGETTGYLAPYSSRYFDLSQMSGDILIEFNGDIATRQVPTRCHSGDRCWWGNRGDSIDTSLTREFDLTALSTATLEFMTWFDIEEDWDYAYVEASTDGGQTWTILEGVHTTEEDPIGNSYGHGYTGSSSGWLNERIDLTPFVGSKVLVRFEYITDAAVYENGFVIDDIAIAELDFLDDAETEKGWTAQGFERIDNVVPVDYVVLVIERRRDGTEIVRRMEIDEDRRGGFAIGVLGQEVERLIVVVSPIARNTHQLSKFTLTVSEGS